MKALLVVAMWIFAASALAEESYVMLGSRSFVRSPDGVTLRLQEGDCLPMNGKTETGAWVKFSIAGMPGSIPWHEAKVVPATPKCRDSYRRVVQRLRTDYAREIAKREAARDRAMAKAQERAEREAIAREDRQRQQVLWELQNIGDQLEILNLRRR